MCGPGRVAGHPGESCELGDTEDAWREPPGAPHPIEAKGSTGVGVRPSGQSIWGASKSFGSQANAGSLITTILLFGPKANVPNGPLSGHSLRTPSVLRGRLRPPPGSSQASRWDPEVAGL